MSLVAQSVSWSIGGQCRVEQVSMQCGPGEIVAVLGPNGAGKSSLLHLLAGSLSVDAGYIELEQRELAQYSAAELAQRRALLAQSNPVAFNFCVADVIGFGRYPYAESQQQSQAVIEAVAEVCDVAHLLPRHYIGLSGGEAQRVQLARALTQLWGGQQSRYLLLDEPTAALDLAHQHQCLARIRQWAQTQQVGVVWVVHDLNLALHYSDRAILLQQGRCVGFGPSSEVLTSKQVSECFGWPVSRVQLQQPAGEWLLPHPSSSNV